MPVKKDKSKYFEEIFGKDISESENVSDIEKRKNALDKAWECRNFEIKLLWQRAAYFWVFLSIVFIGFYYAAEAHIGPFKDTILFFIAGFGVIFSLSWILVNIGSKYWVNNWEWHIENLESPFIYGNLYNFPSSEDDRRFSVSKINIYIGFFVLTAWILIFLYFYDLTGVSEYLGIPFFFLYFIVLIIFVSIKYINFPKVINSKIIVIVSSILFIIIFVSVSTFLCIFNLNNLIFFLTLFFCEILLLGSISGGNGKKCQRQNKSAPVV